MSFSEQIQDMHNIRDSYMEKLKSLCLDKINNHPIIVEKYGKFLKNWIPSKTNGEDYESFKSVLEYLADKDPDFLEKAQKLSLINSQELLNNRINYSMKRRMDENMSDTEVNTIEDAIIDIENSLQEMNLSPCLKQKHYRISYDMLHTWGFSDDSEIRLDQLKNVKLMVCSIADKYPGLKNEILEDFYSSFDAFDGRFCDI